MKNDPGAYWVCGDCGEEVSAEVAAGDDECPDCGGDMAEADDGSGEE